MLAVDANGVRQAAAKTTLREIAVAIGFSLNNGSRNPSNARQLCVEILSVLRDRGSSIDRGPCNDGRIGRGEHILTLGALVKLCRAMRRDVSTPTVRLPNAPQIRQRLPPERLETSNRNFA